MNIEINYSDLNTSGTIEKSKPGFTKVEPDFQTDRINKDFENLVVIGNGGSITSLRALYYAFLKESDKNLEIVSTMDPDRLDQIRNTTSPENTLVMPISKSGSTVGVLESLLYFINHDYDFNPLTTRNSPLHNIAKKYNNQIIEHQDVGGRFSGLTNTALAPAELLGLDSHQIRKGGSSAYSKEDTKAREMAIALKNAEEKGYDEVLTPFYSSRMFGFYPLLIQLMHETVCKDDKGQSFYGDHAPEYQHHTNQRLFGGKKNILPIFFRSNYRKEKITIPDKIKDVEIRGKKLKMLDDQNLSNSLNSEYLGVRKTLEKEEMPYIDINLKETGYQGFGSLLAFLQLLAYYSARIRNVDPFTQPNVEQSKQIGYEERFK